MFEHLETRRLLTIPLSGGVLQLSNYVGGGNDQVELVLNAGTYTLRTIAGVNLDTRGSAGVTGININLGAGNDLFRVGKADGTLMPTVAATIIGGTGNDTLTGGNQNDSIQGNDGDDRIDGRAGRDTMDGGNNFDTVDYSTRTVAVTVRLDGTANDGSNSGNNSSPAQYNDQGQDNATNCEAILGGSGNDSLVGNSAANWIDGGGGNDTMLGGAGIDTITGGTATDLGYGEGDNDFFFFKDSVADLFLGGAGTTTAQYDNPGDAPAPALPSALAESAAPLSFFAEFASSGFFVEHSSKTTFSNKIFDVQDMTLQLVGDEEKILVVGTAFDSETFESDSFLARYDQDGTLDTNFGSQGTVFTSFSNFAGGEGLVEGVESVVIDPAGKILIAGWIEEQFSAFSEDFTGYGNWTVAKYNADGSLDTNFGGFGSGMMIIDPDGRDSYDSASAIVVQTTQDGSDFITNYLVGGTIGEELFNEEPEFTDDDFGIIRLGTNGALDTNFGSDGLVRTNFSEGSYDTLEDLVVDPSTNNIWAVGSSSGDDDDTDFAVVGYFSNGSEIDGTKTTTDVSDGDNDYASDALIDNDGQLVVVGTISLGESDTGGAIATYNTEIFTSFFVAEAANNFTQVFQDNAITFNGVALDADGHAIAVGRKGDDFFMYHFDTSTLEEVSPGLTSDFRFDDESSFDEAYAAALMSNGKMIVAGTTDDGIAWLRLRDATPEEPPFVDDEITDEELETFQFFIGGDPTKPVPNYLVQRVQALDANGIFEVFGTPGEDIIKAYVKDGIFTVSVNGSLLTQTASSVTGLVIHGLAGNDSIHIEPSVTVPTTVNGGDGNDTFCGSNQPDEFNGGNGNDQFWGLGGADKGFGGEGHDAMLGGDGNDSLWGGNGRDFLVGGRGQDYIRGEAGEDIIFGGATFMDNDCTPLNSFLVEIASGNSLTTRVLLIGTLILRIGTRFSLISDDNEIDNLGGGADKDWIIAKTTGSKADVITDLVSSDVLTRI